MALVHVCGLQLSAVGVRDMCIEYQQDIYIYLHMGIIPDYAMYIKIITAFLITIKLIDPIPYSLIWMVNWLTETVNRSIHLCINWSYSALINPTRYINCMFTNFNVKPTSFCGCDVSQVTSCPTPSTGSGSGESSSSGEGSSSREASCSFGEVVDSALAFYNIRYYLW